MQQVDASAEIILARCDLLATFSEEGDCLTRRFATPAMRAVNNQVADWMRAAGMSVREDAIGNIIGRYEARASSAKTLLLGSHLDTVRDAGRYDGPLGVMTAVQCVARLHLENERLPFAIEVYGFADEEGLRYIPYLGSRAVAGRLGAEELALLDQDGITLATAISDFGGNPSGLDSCRRDQTELLGYCEVHIEQGPRLEQEGLPVGIVSAIQGQSRAQVAFSGTAGHAGTVPASLRRDALTAGSEFILAVESFARRQEPLMATVGRISVYPGASNVIPGRVELSLDLRHPSDKVRLIAARRLEERARRIAARRGIGVEWSLSQSTPSVLCDTQLAGLLEQAILGQNLRAMYLASGAGHDAAVMAGLTPSAMLFVRCREGISHNPLESVTMQDVGTAARVLGHFLDLAAERYAV
ncbi:MAG: allantoate amidohydrolase [Chloroflexi bacterium]|nr:MAG: allantoate amidohydrolase [Chloroflexota bacterium]